MDGQQALEGEGSIDKFVQAGLTKREIGGINIYTLDVTNNEKAKSTLDTLKELISSKRIAAEVGPGNQLDSLLFAGKHAQADVVIGIDSSFDYSTIETPVRNGYEKIPEIILLKGDVWNGHISDFFGAQEVDKSKRLAIYSQILSPDSMNANALISSTRSLSRDGSICVLDSGTVEDLDRNYYPENSIYRKILNEAGIKDASHLEWLKHLFRDTRQTEPTREEYEESVAAGQYPPSSYLRDGKMLVFNVPVSK